MQATQATTVTLAEVAGLSADSYIKVRALLVDLREVPSFDKSVVKFVVQDPSTKSYSFKVWTMTYEQASTSFIRDRVYDFWFCTKKYANSANNVTYVGSLLEYELVEETDTIVRQFKPHSIQTLLSANKMYFENKLDQIHNRSLKRMVQLAYGMGKVPEGFSERAYRERYATTLRAYASTKFHDCYEGGYVNHIVGMLRIADLLRLQYNPPGDNAVGRIETGSQINWDIVFAGIYLHDVGKLTTYEGIGERIRFREDQLLDHSAAGVGVIYQLYSEIEPEYKPSWGDFQTLASICLKHGKLDRLLSDSKQTDSERIVTLIDAIDAMMVANLTLG